jgi:hypothetical protein
MATLLASLEETLRYDTLRRCGMENLGMLVDRTAVQSGPLVGGWWTQGTDRRFGLPVAL